MNIGLLSLIIALHYYVNIKTTPRKNIKYLGDKQFDLDNLKIISLNFYKNPR